VGLLTVKTDDVVVGTTLWYTERTEGPEGPEDDGGCGGGGGWASCGGPGPASWLGPAQAN